MKFGLLTLFDHYAEDCSEEQYYKNFFDEAVYAEELGFDSIWIGEHHFCRYICPAPQIIAGGLAQRTKKMRIGTSIALLPHHDPIRLAEDYALVDLLSGGRLDFGVGRGFIKATYDGFNQAMTESRGRFDECLEIIEGTWRQQDFSYGGQFYRTDHVTILPRPLQRPAPPIFMAAALSPESFVAAGKKGHSLMLAPFFQSRATLKKNVELYQETLRQSGYEPGSVDIVAGYHSFVDETPELARKKWEHHFMRYMRFVGGLIDPSGYANDQYESWRNAPRLTFDRMYPDQLLCADATQCVERVALLAEEFGVTHFWVYMDLGGLPQHELRASMERFATRVMPQFR
jgi:alkanesulfonate monooxygenase SsuD/methylene tetrahydromethanopterin reductase-like flavin-dependent oxidoreductase (luciferase family)